MKPNILFLCTGNSCRSQMAEGWGKELKSGDFNFYSAGIEKHGLNPLAVEVMQEVGVDISQQVSNNLDEFSDIKMDYVITVCSNAVQSCPVIPGRKVVHIGFDDPPTLAIELKDHQAVLAIYRRVRDEIKKMVLELDYFVVEKLAN